MSGYKERIQQAGAQLLVPGVHHIQVHHQDGCQIWDTGDCTCDPEVTFSTRPQSTINIHSDDKPM